MARPKACDAYQRTKVSSGGPLSCRPSKTVSSNPGAIGASSTPPTRNLTSSLGRISSATVEIRGTNRSAITTSRILLNEYEKSAARLSPAISLAARLPSAPPASTQYRCRGCATTICARKTALAHQMGALSSSPMVLSDQQTKYASVVTANASSTDGRLLAQRDDMACMLRFPLGL